MAAFISHNDGLVPLIGHPEQIYSHLETLRELARPMKPAWEEKYLAVFSCGVDGRVFRPEDVGYPQDKQTEEDLRQVSSLLRKIADHFQSIRPEGGRFYLRREGAFTWDESRKRIVCFLMFPDSTSGARRSEPEQLGTAESRSSSPDSGTGLTIDTDTHTDKVEAISRENFVEQLTKIPRLGSRKAQALWRHGYRSIEDLKNTPVTELTQVPWVGAKVARRIKSVLGAFETGSAPDVETSLEGSSKASVQVKARSTSIQDFRKPYSIFQADSLEQLRVQTIRARAKNLREMVRSHRVPSFEMFSSAVYRFETETKIDGRDLSGALFNPWISMPEGLIRELCLALNEERATLAGNYLWGGDHGFAEHLTEQQDLRSIIEEAFRLLGLLRIAPVEQAERVADLPGFGPVSASGLVTMCRPDGFTLLDKRPFEMMGMEVDSLRGLSEWFPTVREELGAEDGLELARFIRILQDEGFEMLLRRHNENT